MHVDATGEDGRGTMLAVIAGWRGWVLGSWKIPTENADAMISNLTMVYNRRKLNQILATCADYCITPCHNCHAQIHDLAEHYEGNYHTVHLWTLICLSLGILGENEREYLGPDLAEVGL